MSSKPEGAPECARPRCKRWRNLDDGGLCGGHACPTPTCRNSKSSTEPVCDRHKDDSKRVLPKGFQKVLMNRVVVVYLNMKTLVAQYNHPGEKGEIALPRKSKIKPAKGKKGYPTNFSVQPQPSDLPDGWEAMLSASRHGIFALYQNNVEGTIQQSDPRPPKVILPEGWTIAYDDDADPYYIDHNSKIATYDDPRTTDNPVPSATLAKGLFKQRRASHASRRKSKKKRAVVWQIPKRDTAAFRKIENYLTMPDEIPEVVRNKKHNRYMDILPNPKTRVLLEGDDDEAKYINANFVRGFDDNPHYYIAAQGPLKNSLDHFWRMIWEQKVAAIVMVTGLIEKGKNKCERYWPNQKGDKMQFGDITVQTIGTQQGLGYAYSTLKATRGGKSLKVGHFWYNTWPDHGVPRGEGNVIYSDNVLEMLMSLHKFRKSVSGDGPIMVHCSAGIGRTGTFIAIDHAIQLLQKENKVDCLGIIDNIRHDRCALVQHAQQFDFFHDACVRYAEMSDTPFKVEGEEKEIVEPEEPDEEDIKQVLQKEKEEAKKRATITRSNPMTQSQMSGELSLGTVTYKGEILTFLDLDGDGRMDFAEAKCQGMSKEAFDAIDANGDGVITTQEFSAFLKKNAA